MLSLFSFICFRTLGLHLRIELLTILRITFHFCNQLIHLPKSLAFVPLLKEESAKSSSIRVLKFTLVHRPISMIHGTFTMKIVLIKHSFIINTCYKGMMTLSPSVTILEITLIFISISEFISTNTVKFPIFSFSTIFITIYIFNYTIAILFSIFKVSFINISTLIG